jgi:hypothetical protein
MKRLASIRELKPDETRREKTIFVNLDELLGQVDEIRGFGPCIFIEDLKEITLYEVKENG